ncbi:MAG: GNAT family N-acetyltransferase [Micrococcales bacterium]|nr:GNAT family N-acetyltransferase [Micrococcales bacterium]
MTADTLTGAILTVIRAPWDDAPDCPFVIELFVAPEARRRSGLGRTLLRTAAAALSARGESRLALRVERDNHPALALYTAEGFRPA